MPTCREKLLPLRSERGINLAKRPAARRVVRTAAATFRDRSRYESAPSKQLIEPKDWQRVQAIRQVAHALSLHTFGRFHAPRMFMVGPLVRTVLVRADNDNEGIGQAMIDADLFAQIAEIRALGIWWCAGLTDVSIKEQPPRMVAALDQMVMTLEQLWPAVIELSNELIAERSLLGSDFSKALDKG